MLRRQRPGDEGHIVYSRIDLINTFVAKLGAQVYLEIGVQAGASFLEVECRRKIGVDPCFKIKPRKKIKHRMRALGTGDTIAYHKMTSDVFFAKHQRSLASRPPKVIFIDGLHTFKQTLADCYNSLNCLAEGGVIVLHDCSPPHPASATPGMSPHAAEHNWHRANPSPEGARAWTGEWCGDTWKTIPYLLKNHSELKVCVLDADYGLGIVSPKSLTNPVRYALPPAKDDSIDRLDFAFLAKNREKILNLKNVGEVNEVIKFYC